MKTKTKEVYYCEYCKKHGLSKHRMIYHESICSKNPENDRPCFHCEYLDKKVTWVYDDCYDGSDMERKIDLLYCSKKGHFVYTPKNEIKGNMYDLGDDANEPMPKECDYFKNNSIEVLDDIH